MKAEEYKIVKSMNYEEMIPMFIEAGLEMEPDEKVPENLLSCYEMIEEISSKRIGGASLVFMDNVFVIKTVAIQKEFQRKGLGTKLISYVMEDIRNRGGTKVYLNAKIPDFYEALGFQILDRKNAPDISNCHLCDNYHNGCNPEIMEISF